MEMMDWVVVTITTIGGAKVSLQTDRDQAESFQQQAVSGKEICLCLNGRRCRPLIMATTVWVWAQHVAMVDIEDAPAIRYCVSGQDLEAMAATGVIHE